MDSNKDREEREERYEAIKRENERLREEARQAEISARMAENKAIREANKKDSSYAWVGLIALILIAIVLGGGLGGGQIDTLP